MIIVYGATVGNWIINTIVSMGYWGIVLLMCFENVFPPIPSEFIMPLAGYLVTKEEFTLWGIIVAGTVGTLAGTVPLYYVGAKVGKRRLHKFVEKHGRWLALSTEDIENTDKWFDRHGGKAVLIGRLVPGIRSLISIPAGMNKMHFGKFLLFTTIGTALWVSFLAYAGYLLGRNFRDIEQYLDIAAYAVLALIVILYVRRLIVFNNKKKKRSKSATVRKSKKT